MRLYDISEGYVALALRAEDGEDVSEELARLDDALTDKAEGVLYVLRNLELDAEALGTEIKRLTERKRTAENNVRRMREHLRDSMEKANATRIKTPRFVVTLSPGSEVVDVEDEAKLSPEWFRVTREPNKSAILSNYRATGEIPEGVRIERGTKLVIR